jgi:hypothetical protein
MKRKARFQQTFALQSSFAKYGRKSKRELFLDQMNQVIPWSELLALVEPFYPQAGSRWAWRLCCGLTFCSSVWFFRSRDGGSLL